MRRINTGSKAVDLFGAGKHGFTSGNDQASIDPTAFSSDWSNDVQESIARCIESTGGTLNASGDLDLTYAVRRAAHKRKPITGDGGGWSTFQTHTDSGTAGTWRFYERTFVVEHQPDDSIAVLGAGGAVSSDLPNNSRMWIDVHAICLDDVDVDSFHQVVLRASAKKSGGTIQDITLDTVSAAGGVAVTWGLVADGQGGLIVTADIPSILGLRFFNLMAHVRIRAVTLAS